VLGKRLDSLASNAGAVALYTDFAALPSRHRNYIRLIFTDPAIRSLHRAWEHDAHDAVGVLRMEGAKDPDDPDPDLAQLVGELSLLDEDFRTWWAARDVNCAACGRKRYRHPLVGDLDLDLDTWTAPMGAASGSWF
jgi:hypothetical protein